MSAGCASSSCDPITQHSVTAAASETAAAMAAMVAVSAAVAFESSCCGAELARSSREPGSYAGVPWADLAGEAPNQFEMVSAQKSKKQDFGDFDETSTIAPNEETLARLDEFEDFDEFEEMHAELTPKSVRDVSDDWKKKGPIRWADLVDSDGDEDEALVQAPGSIEATRQGGKEPVTKAVADDNGRDPQAPTRRPRRRHNKSKGQAATQEQPHTSNDKEKVVEKPSVAPSNAWSKSSQQTRKSSHYDWRKAADANEYRQWTKRQCQFIIGIEEDMKFRVTRKVMGPVGKHMKSISERTGAKLRLRGRGSGFKEGLEQRESTDALMLCVSTTDEASYKQAVRLVWNLLESVYAQYDKFCEANGMTPPHVAVNMHEGAREGSY